MINKLPKSELPREKALKYGIQTLSNIELLAIILRTGTNESTVIELAQEILKKFDGIGGFSNASYQELTQIKGLKEAKALALLTLIEFSKRINLQSYEKNERIDSVDKAYMLFEPYLRNEFQEKFIAIYLDNGLRIIRYIELFKGTLNRNMVHPRDLFREAVKLNASKIIIMHNHPSGDANPSSEDIETSEELFKLGDQIGIPILDHIIIGKGNFYSIRGRILNKNY